METTVNDKPMETTLNIVEIPAKSGQPIDVYPFRVQNGRFKTLLKLTARHMLFCIECDSNNAGSELTLQDVITTKKYQELFKRAWSRAKKFKATGGGRREQSHRILVPTPGEIDAMVNTPLQGLNDLLFTLTQAMLGTQSAKFQMWLGNGSIATVEDIVKEVDSYITDEIGTGEKTEDSTEDDPRFDTGKGSPDYSLLGRVRPNPVESGVEFREPSKAAPPAEPGDVQDK